MKLHKLIIISIVCSLGGIITGCADWLDYTPKDKQTAQQQFSTRDGFYSAVNGIYVKMSGSSLYGYNLSHGSIDLMGQCYNISTNNTSANELVSYSWTGSYASSVFTAIWTDAYACILNANLVLKELEEARGTILLEKDYKLIKGEMLAVRSFLHFDLLRLFGPVYDKNPSELGVPFNEATNAIKSPRLPADQMIKEKLIPDLTTAQGLLEEVDPVITEGVLNLDGEEEGNLLHYRQMRMNYYATTLLKARVHLWAKDYDNALIEASKLTDDATVKKWFPFVDAGRLLANGTNPDRMFSTECLFGYYDKSISSIYQNRFSGTLDIKSFWQPRNGYLSELFASSTLNDYRFQSQWSSSSFVGGAGYDFVKYKSFIRNEEAPEFWATFYGLMRISEAYYIAAECYLQKDDLDNTCNYLHIIARERGFSGPDRQTSTKVSLLKEIKMEYVREMRGEGQIFFLFKRFLQGFASRNGGVPELNGAKTLSKDEPNVSRYVIPIPSGENY